MWRMHRGDSIDPAAHLDTASRNPHLQCYLKSFCIRNLKLSSYQQNKGWTCSHYHRTWELKYRHEVQGLLALIVESLLRHRRGGVVVPIQEPEIRNGFQISTGQKYGATSKDLAFMLREIVLDL